MSVAAGIEGILIHWLGFVKNLFITGQHVEAVVDIFRNIFQDSRGMIRLDMDINGRVPVSCKDKVTSRKSMIF